MSEIVPFLFESTQVRITTDAAGEPWWVAKDVAEALEYTWHHNVIGHVPEEWKGSRPITTPGGQQEMLCLSEQGIYFFLGRSDKKKAIPFQKFLAGHVMPAIRKTGRYEAPTSQAAPILPTGAQVLAVQAHLEAARLMPALVVGLQPAMAVAVALDAIHRDTGLTTEPYRKLLPAASEPPGRFNATAVGKAIGVSARKANALLEAHGWQRRNERGEWELTEAGQEYAEAVPFAKGGHSGYQLLWKPEVVELLP